MNNSVKTIIFDLGGVLYDLDRERCVSALVALGIEDADNLLSNYKQSGVFQQLEEGTIDTDSFYQTIREIAGKPITNEQIKAAWDSFLVSVPQYKLDMLWNLKQRYRILMLSNTNEIHFSEQIPLAFTTQGKTIDDYFDKCYLSYEMHASKPNPLIFNMLIEAEGINPGEALFIDDSPANIEIGAKLGFRTYLAKPFEDFSTLFDAI